MCPLRTRATRWYLLLLLKTWRLSYGVPVSNLLRRETSDNDTTEESLINSEETKEMRTLGSPEGAQSVGKGKRASKGNNILQPSMKARAKSFTGKQLLLKTGSTSKRGPKKKPCGHEMPELRIPKPTTPSGHMESVEEKYRRIKGILDDHALNAGIEPEEVREEQKLTAEMRRLPFQPECLILVGNASGDSDYGTERHTCFACEAGCNFSNQQLPIQMGYSFVPTLTQTPAYDIMMLIELDSISQIKPYSENGIHHRMRFSIHSHITAAGDFVGEMGPRIEGGVEADHLVNGMHVFSLMDTHWPHPDGLGYNPGRWLALPGKHYPGSIGTCRRHCINCDRAGIPEVTQLLTAGHSTGTICTANVKMDSFAKYVYRLVQRKGTRTVEYDAAPYIGTEWQVRIVEPLTGASYVLGTILTEGTSNASGIVHFDTIHEHIGCAPCDAYYQAVRATGPFILNPKGEHDIITAREKMPHTTPEQKCTMRRAVALGGYTVLYESGPGVVQAPTNNSDEEYRKLFKCPGQEPSSEERPCGEGHLRPGSRASTAAWKKLRRIQ